MTTSYRESVSSKRGKEEGLTRKAFGFTLVVMVFAMIMTARADLDVSLFSERALIEPLEKQSGLFML